MNQPTSATTARTAFTWVARLPRKAHSEAALVRDAVRAVADGAFAAYSEFLQPSPGPRENEPSLN